MTPHLFFGLCRALCLVPIVIAVTIMAGRSGLLPEDPATRGRPELEKPKPRERSRAYLQVVGEGG